MFSQNHAFISQTASKKKIVSSIEDRNKENRIL
jgi:hypothetical protein